MTDDMNREDHEPAATEAGESNAAETGQEPAEADSAESGSSSVEERPSSRIKIGSLRDLYKSSDLAPKIAPLNPRPAPRVSVPTPAPKSVPPAEAHAGR